MKKKNLFPKESNELKWLKKIRKQKKIKTVPYVTKLILQKVFTVQPTAFYRLLILFLEEFLVLVDF